MKSRYVAVNTWQDISPEKTHEFLDHGRLVHDLAELGLKTVVTNMDSFQKDGGALHATFDNDVLTLQHGEVDSVNIEAIHSRLVTPHRYLDDGTTDVLNTNNLKKYGASKHRLYKDVLSNHQVATSLIPMTEDRFSAVAATLDLLKAEDLVLKSDSGSGSKSTRHINRKDLLVFVEAEMERDKPRNLIVQPKIDFGELPATIQGVSADDQEVIRHIRANKGLAELRFFVFKSKSDFKTVPVLRVVTDIGDAMGSGSDRYVDVRLSEELESELQGIATAVVEAAALKAGNVEYALAAVDFYFDNEGRAKIMELNLRSPTLPRTNEQPQAGRQAHKSLANTLFIMASKNEDRGEDI